MSSSDEEPDNVEVNSELVFVASELCSFPEILEKSQIPTMKKLKDESIKKFILKYQSLFGKEVDAKTLMKKINNMKTRLKKKTDLNRTGNKNIQLLDWEKKMLVAMKGESNPTVKRIPGKLY